MQYNFKSSEKDTQCGSNSAGRAANLKNMDNFKSCLQEHICMKFDTEPNY